MLDGDKGKDKDKVGEIRGMGKVLEVIKDLVEIKDLEVIKDLVETKVLVVIMVVLVETEDKDLIMFLNTMTIQVNNLQIFTLPILIKVLRILKILAQMYMYQAK